MVVEVGRKIKTTGVQTNINYIYALDTYLLQCDNNGRCVVVEVGRKIRQQEFKAALTNIHLTLTVYNVTKMEDVW